MSTQLLNPVTGDTQLVADTAAGYWTDRGWQIVETGFPSAAPFVNLPVPSVYSPGACKTLIDKLRFGVEPGAILCQGDFTGNTANEWFVAMIDWLRLKFPAHSFPYVSWSDTQQAWVPDQAGRPNYNRQIGTAGDAYATGFAGANNLQTPDNAQFDILGDIDVRAKLRATDWTPASQMTIVSKQGGVGARGLVFRIIGGSTGQLQLEMSTDGTAISAPLSSVGVAFADNTDGWVRATSVSSTGVTQFFTSTDGVNWTQLGTNQAMTVGPYFNNAVSPEIGSRQGGTDVWAGRIYYVEVRAGIGSAGVPKLLMDFDVAIGTPVHITSSGGTFQDCLGFSWTRTGSAITFAGAPGIMIYDGNYSGGTLTYFNDGTRGPKVRAILPPDLTYINLGHQDGTLTSYRTPFKQLADACLAAWPDTGIVAVTQNPQTAPRTAEQIAAQAIRMRQIVSLAASQNYGLLDAYFAMLTDYRELDDLVSSADGLAPLQDGQDLWRDVGKAMFAPWIPYPRYNLIS